MKQLIILLLLLILGIFGYSRYNTYKRYNAPNVDYKTDRNLDLNYYNQEIVLKYYKTIEDLNSFVMMQWTVNEIDVRTPEEDNASTKIAINTYAEKLASIKYFEEKLANSANLKSKGLSNKEIQFIEETGLSLNEHLKKVEQKSYENKIKSMFENSEAMFISEKSSLIFEVQKLLVKNGFKIAVDGLYKTETLNAIKSFEQKNELFPDGKLDILTLDALLQ